MAIHKFALAGAVAVVASTAGIVGTASATTIQFTSAAFSGRSSFSPSLTQFDPSLGTLTGIEIDLTMQLTPIVSVFNASGGPLAFTDSFTNSIVSWSAFTQTASDNYSYDLSTGGIANPGLNEFDGPSVAESSSTIVPGGSFASFEGVGSTSVTYNVSGGINDGGSPGTPLFHGGDRQFDGTATVTYTFTSSAPEPASLTLAGIGMVALLRRRRSSR